MVIWSDLGGSVFRFMIERGMLLGIVGDVGKFFLWVNLWGYCLLIVGV